MTVGELIEYLEEFNEDAEVRLMTQQQWPFENSVAGVCSKEQCAAEDEAGADPAEATVVYVVEGSQLEYGTKRAWEVIP